MVATEADRALAMEYCSLADCGSHKPCKELKHSREERACKTHVEKFVHLLDNPLPSIETSS